MFFRELHNLCHNDTYLSLLYDSYGNTNNAYYRELILFVKLSIIILFEFVEFDLRGQIPQIQTI